MSYLRAFSDGGSLPRSASRPVKVRSSRPSDPDRIAPRVDIRTALVKRCVDLVLSALGLVLLSPVLVLVAVLVRLSGPGPVLLRQPRVGSHDVVFSMLKFRTMVDGAEPARLAVWTCENDWRLTSVGRFLRRTHLDELPQMWNVVRGEMSLVGPRPERPELDTLLRSRVPAWGERYTIRPGLTGWAQIRQGYASSVVESEEKLAHDLWYLQHRNLPLDVAILARTAWAVIRSIPPPVAA